MTAILRFVFFQFLLISSIVNAQSSYHMSLNTTNGGTVDLVNSSDNNVIILGDNCIPAVVKMDYSGNILWNVHYSTEDFFMDGRFIIELTDEGLVFLVSDYNNQACLIKLDPNGQLIWAKSIDPIFRTAVAAPDGGFLLAGGSKMLKMDPQGNIIWQKSLTTTGPYITQIIVNSAGNYIFCGFSSSDMLVFETDVNGIMVWAKTYGGTESDYAYSIVECNDSGYLVGGTFRFQGSVYNQLALLKIDATGDLEWSKLYQGPSEARFRRLKISTAGNLYAIGDADGKILYMKMDQTGNIDWVKTTGGPGYCSGSSFDFVEDEKIFMGIASGFAFVKLETNGDGFCDSKNFNLQVINVILSQEVKQFVTSNTSFITHPVSAPLDDNHTFEPQFMCKNGKPVIEPMIIDQEENFSLFPNPFNDFLIIKSPNYTIVNFTLYDSLGRVVFIKTNFESYISGINLDAGVYFYTLSHSTDGSILHSGKLLKL